MTTFVRNCGCQGRQPEGIATARHVPRTNLIARLLRQRDVARFLVAPPGSGRTTLAWEYAGLVFGFKHVFWVPCTSPCFLRDLDAGILASSIIAADASVSLVVWEDVPHLSPGRAEAFAALLDELLAQGVEMLVTTTPLADAFAALQRDRVSLGAVDLLLSDEEMRSEAAEGRMLERWEAECLPCERIALIRWGSEGASGLLPSIVQEEMPSELRLAMLVLLVLGRGSLEDLSGFMPEERAQEALDFLERHYPIFGIDARIGRFHAMDVDPVRLSEAFYRCIEPCAEASHHGSRDVLCAHMADALVGQMRIDRGSQVAVSFLSKSAMGDWAVRNGYRLLMAGCSSSFMAIDARLSGKSPGLGGELGALRAWASFMAGDPSQGALESKRQAGCVTATLRSRLAAGVLATRCALGDARKAAARAVRGWLEEAEGRPLAANQAQALRGEAMDWPFLGTVASTLVEEPPQALSVWLAGLDAEWREAALGAEAAARRNALLLGAAWLLDDQASVSYAISDVAIGGRALRHAEGARAMGSLDDVARFVRDAVEAEASCGPLGWCAAMAGAALERLGAETPRFMAYAASPEAAARLHEAEVALFEQHEEAMRMHGGAAAIHPALQGHAHGPRTLSLAQGLNEPHSLGVPLLHVRLFGGLEVRIGDKMVPPSLLSRHKTRLLLALLVLNHGHEMPRVRIAEMLWPASVPKSAMKNFYSVWSQLRRALSLDGSCPYLIRTREGCSLDERLVVADVDGFEELCRSLHFRQGEEQDWERLYARVCDDYGDDLLPCDYGNEMVDAKRQHYHSLLVEALVSASRWLGESGDSRGALWFAREGVRRDDRREDVYLALMESQVLAGQRCDAMETYFACRRFLSEELGIDPSPRLVELYRSIIESEQALA